MSESLSKIQWDCVLIDDDPLMLMTWKLAARTAGKTIRTFPSSSSFLAAISEIHTSTVIYIDSDLGEGVKGQDFAKHLFELGFTTLYLETGYSPEDFGPMPWIRGIIGKDPPW